MSGNSLLHVGNLSFQDGTSISSGTIVNPGLTQVLSYGNSAGTYNINMNKNAILDLSYILFSDGKTQNSSYTGWSIPSSDSFYTYNSATLTFDMYGQITNVIDNSISIFGLEDVLTKSGDGGGKAMTNIGNISQTSGTTSLNDTSFNGNITQTGGINNLLNTTTFNGNISQTSGTTSLNDTSFGGNITQTGGINNLLNTTTFNGNISQTSGTTSLNDTSFNGNITQTGGTTSFGGNITQTGGTNSLNTTTFNGNMFLNTSGSYLQFPDGTQQTTAYTNKTYSTEYTATNTSIPIPTNCLGISIRLVGKGGSAGNSDDSNGGHWNSGGSGSGASMCQSQPIIPITSGNLSLTINNSVGQSSFITYNGTEICRSYNGNTGGHATNILAGTAGAIQANGSGNLNASTWLISIGTAGIAGTTNISYQNCGSIPTIAGNPNCILTTGTDNDAVRGCGQRYSADGGINICPTPTGILGGSAIITFYTI
jgi:hypothetical protein